MKFLPSRVRDPVRFPRRHPGTLRTFVPGRRVDRVRLRRSIQPSTRSTRRAVRPTKKWDAPPIDLGARCSSMSAVTACDLTRRAELVVLGEQDELRAGVGAGGRGSSSQCNGRAIAHQPAWPASRIDEREVGAERPPDEVRRAPRVGSRAVRRARRGRRAVRRRRRRRSRCWRRPRGSRSGGSVTPRSRERPEQLRGHERPHRTAVLRMRMAEHGLRVAAGGGASSPSSVSPSSVTNATRSTMDGEPKVRGPCPPASTTRPRSRPLGDGRLRRDDGRVVVGAPRSERRVPRRGRSSRALSAAVDDPARSPRSLTVHYANPAGAGDVQITHESRPRRPLDDHVLGADRAGRSSSSRSRSPRSPRRVRGIEFCDLVMPQVPGPQHYVARPVPRESPPIAHRWETRWAIGHPPVPGAPRGARAVAGGWIRLPEGREVDAFVAAAITDAWIPPTFSRVEEPVFVPTVDLTIHFRAELPAPGPRRRRVRPRRVPHHRGRRRVPRGGRRGLGARRHPPGSVPPARDRPPAPLTFEARVAEELVRRCRGGRRRRRAARGSRGSSGRG